MGSAWNYEHEKQHFEKGGEGKEKMFRSPCQARPSNGRSELPSSEKQRGCVTRLAVTARKGNQKGHNVISRCTIDNK